MTKVWAKTSEGRQRQDVWSSGWGAGMKEKEGSGDNSWAGQLGPWWYLPWCVTEGHTGSGRRCWGAGGDSVWMQGRKHLLGQAAKGEFCWVLSSGGSFKCVVRQSGLLGFHRHHSTAVWEGMSPVQSRGWATVWIGQCKSPPFKTQLKSLPCSHPSRTHPVGLTAPQPSEQRPAPLTVMVAGGSWGHCTLLTVWADPGFTWG